MILDEEILAYAEEHYKEHKHSGVGLWNGRQIRNAFRTAAALAYHSAGVEIPILSTQLFKNVAKTTDEFDKYINSVHGETSEEQRAYDHVERIDLPAKESGKGNRSTYMTPQPVTPSDPRGRAFGNNRPHELQKKLEDSGYANQGNMVEISSEHAMIASSSARSSRTFMDTTRVPEFAVPGASVSTGSPILAARAVRSPTMNHGQGYSNLMDSEDEDEDEDE